MQAAVVVDELVRCGVREVVLCPGSRNAPLALALAAADRAGRLRLHVRLDERGAGFLALGLALGTDRPAAVVMTSGTAVANLGPAVLEADHAGVPLLVLSADRPIELVGTGASQTIDQSALFGRAVRASLTLGLARPGEEGQNGRWRAAVCRAVLAAAGHRGVPGPVQLDVPLAEPLVPDPGRTAAEAAAEVWPGRPGGEPWTATVPATADAPVPVDLTVDTVVIAGHGAGPAPELAGVPTVAEPTAGPRQAPLHPMALALLAPRRAIVLGRPTLHRSVTALLADPQVDVVALGADPRWPDVPGRVGRVGTRAEVRGAVRAQWAAECAAADTRARAATAQVLAEADAPTGLHVAAALTAALRAGDRLVVGASNPIRDLALTGPVPAGVTVESNRGVAGIDGVVSTAIGAALAHDRDAPGSRTVALLGDLTFLHDLTALIIGPGEPRPRDLVLVVADDDGGGIFTLLEQGQPRFADAFERVFATPHGTDLPALCRAHGIPVRAATPAELPAALAGEGLRVVHVRTRRDGLRDMHARIADAAGR